MDIRFGTLEGQSSETLYQAFMEAFADYAVPINVTMDDFLAMQRRRGVSYAASVGAFDGDRIAGFIFNGDGDWKGRRCAYDAGTGVLPAYRGGGLSGALAAESLRLLRTLGFERWLLEVLVDNEKAIRTYRKAGFTTTRRFSCPDGSVPDAAAHLSDLAAAARVRIGPLMDRDVSRFASWRIWEPSWQNSDASLARTPETLRLLGAWDAAASHYGDEEPVGYIVATAKGSVFQLAVRPDARRRGIGRTLVAALAALTPGHKVRCVNVQADDEATLGLLAGMGISGGPDQWEMELEL